MEKRNPRHRFDMSRAIVRNIKKYLEIKKYQIKMTRMTVQFVLQFVRRILSSDIVLQEYIQAQKLKDQARPQSSKRFSPVISGDLRDDPLMSFRPIYLLCAVKGFKSLCPCHIVIDLCLGKPKTSQNSFVV